MVPSKKKKSQDFSSEIFRLKLRHNQAQAAQKPFTVDRTNYADRVLTRIPTNARVASIPPGRSDAPGNPAEVSGGATVAE
jgi:hypothetical protein